jgi:hypothetical protein
MLWHFLAGLCFKNLAAVRRIIFFSVQRDRETISVDENPTHLRQKPVFRCDPPTTSSRWMDPNVPTWGSQ